MSLLLMRVISCLVCCLFFFSSRRRHTRLVSDWSSDVCSSDLLLEQALRHTGLRRKIREGHPIIPGYRVCRGGCDGCVLDLGGTVTGHRRAWLGWRRAWIEYALDHQRASPAWICADHVEGQIGRDLSNSRSLLYGRANIVP